MKQTLKIALFTLLTSIATVAHADQYVRGHIRSDGTYQGGYYRSTPDDCQYNNYSYRGNYNPYTGERGTQSGNSWSHFQNNPGYFGHSSYFDCED